MNKGLLGLVFSFLFMANVSAHTMENKDCYLDNKDLREREIKTLDLFKNSLERSPFYNVNFLILYDKDIENYVYPNFLFKEALDAFVSAAERWNLARMEAIHFQKISLSKEQAERLYSACEQYMPRLWDIAFDRITIDYETALVLSKFCKMADNKAEELFGTNENEKAPQGGCYFDVRGLTDDQIKQLNTKLGREAFVNKSKR